MKRLWILLLVAAFLAPMVTGCENNKEREDEDGASLKVDVDD
jgi:hypothetical protein